MQCQTHEPGEKLSVFWNMGTHELPASAHFSTYDGSMSSVVINFPTGFAHTLGHVGWMFHSFALVVLSMCLIVKHILVTCLIVKCSWHEILG